ncbi:cadherin-13 isoform X4 [Ailuropoda melanoleuca]|uniref:cadherin-13 isoform X4 n=1 Tax=Ailuropoda melanoleuca TaxID=9646 RepID=UPI001493F360|nr:cadherin-13 isoform X4 [Ailuropoda melanoleuca]
MQPRTPLLLCVLLSQVLLLTSAEDLDCTPGFQQKVFHINQPAQFIEDQAILNLTFSDCKGNNKLHYEVSSPYFKVNNDGSLVALKNITAVGKTLFVHARTPHAEDMAELVIVGGKDIQGSLQDIFKFARTSPVPRQKRSIVVSPILIPENQRQPFPRDVGKVVDSDRPEGSKFRLTGKGVDQEPKGIFRINENTGSVSVTRTLDRETMATYQLFVETTDVNGKTLEGPVPLEVIVIDQNDNRPIFREGPYIGHVMEGSPTGTTVMRMTAFDADDPATDNALLRYNIRQQTPDKPSPNMFYIDPEKGDIVTVVSPALLDREGQILLSRLLLSLPLSYDHMPRTGSHSRLAESFVSISGELPSRHPLLGVAFESTSGPPEQSIENMSAPFIFQTIFHWDPCKP